MSYGCSAALQAAIFARLSLDPVLAGLAPGAVFDAAPPGPLPDLWISLGPEVVRDRSDQSGGGADHDLTLTVTTSRPGFSDAKSAAVAIGDALAGPMPVLARGRIVGVMFLRAEARASGGMRRIALTYRVRVEDGASAPGPPP